MNYLIFCVFIFLKVHLLDLKYLERVFPLLNYFWPHFINIWLKFKVTFVGVFMLISIAALINLFPGNANVTQEMMTIRV